MLSGMEDHRTSQRIRTYKAGTIDFGLGSFECTVRNLSDKGASLETASPFGIPDRFNLRLASDGTRKACRVVWRRGQRLGVVFIASV
jgi:hypothetical protein